MLSFAAKSQDNKPVLIDSVYSDTVTVRMQQLSRKTGKVIRTFKKHTIHVRSGKYYTFSDGWALINNRWYTKEQK